MDEFLTGRDEHRSTISRYLTYLSLRLELLNNNHLTDLNDSLEQTFCGLLNRIFDWNLTNLNNDEKNFPGIDLADKDRRLSVQISSDATPGKVRETLRTFFEKNLDYDYREIYIVFMRSYRSTVNRFHDELARPFPFSFDDHVWDTDSIFSHISSLEDASKLKAIADYLRSECGKFPDEADAVLGSLETAPLCSEFYIKGSRTEQLDNLAPKLQESNPLFIWGPGGIGKTQMARKLAWDYKTGKGRYTIKYIPSPYEKEEAMLATILNAPIGGKCFIGADPEARRDAFTKRLAYIEKHFSGATVIIDDFYIPGYTLDDLKREQAFRDLTGIGLHLIFTTRYSCNAHHDVHITELPEKLLMNHIRDYCHDKNLTDDRLRPLLTLIGCNSMLAYLLSETMIQGFLEPEQIVAALESGDYSNTVFPSISDDRTGLIAPFHEHLYKLYDIDMLDGPTRQVLALAAIAPNGKIEQSVFAHALSLTQKTLLRELVRSSWILQENGMLIVYPVVSLVCRNRLSPALDTLKNFLFGLKSRLDSNTYTLEQQFQVISYFDAASPYFANDSDLRTWHREILQKHTEEGW